MIWGKLGILHFGASCALPKSAILGSRPPPPRNQMNTSYKRWRGVYSPRQAPNIISHQKRFPIAGPYTGFHDGGGGARPSFRRRGAKAPKSQNFSKILTVPFM